MFVPLRVHWYVNPVGVVPAGLEDRLLVFTLNCCPNVAVPVIDTVPARVGVAAVDVLILAATLAAEARCVAVSAILCVKLYEVPALKLPKVGELCQVPEPLWYSAPATVCNVMLVVVLLALVGAPGAAGPAAFATAAVAAELTVPEQLPAPTTTLIVWPTSAATGVYVAPVAPLMLAVPRCHW